MKYKNVRNAVIVTVNYASVESGNVDGGYFYSFIDEELEEHNTICMDAVTEVLEVSVIDEICNLEIDDEIGYAHAYIDDKERIYNADIGIDPFYDLDDGRHVLYPIHRHFMDNERCVRFLRQRGLI